jgi:hypothetical protein
LIPCLFGYTGIELAEFDLKVHKRKEKSSLLSSEERGNPNGKI